MKYKEAKAQAKILTLQTGIDRAVVKAGLNFEVVIAKRYTGKPEKIYKYEDLVKLDKSKKGKTISDMQGTTDKEVLPGN